MNVIHWQFLYTMVMYLYGLMNDNKINKYLSGKQTDFIFINDFIDTWP
jgi:hypothetical protein